MRRILMPIHIKLNSFIMIILAASLGLYVFYATNLFEKDKYAYVYDTIRSHNKGLVTTIDDRFINMSKVHAMLEELSVSGRFSKKIFDQYPSLLGHVEAIATVDQKNIWVDSVKKDHRKISSELRSKIIKSKPSSKGMERENNRMIFWRKNPTNWSATIWQVDKLDEIIAQGRLFKDVVLDGLGNVLLGSSQQLDYAGLLMKTKEMGLDLGTFSYHTPIGSYIVSFQKLEMDANKTVFTLVEEAKALEAGKLLKNKSIYFGLFVLSLTVMLVLLYSRLFTTPIKKLFDASQRFANKDFDFRVKMKNRDEIGALGDSFNSMADEIVLYMDQMQEKNRLENELKTAQLVQKSFFPFKSLTRDWFDLNAYYRPATECGGDWWGVVEKKDKLIFIMIDATGHGTAAALLTAVIHNCLTTLDYLIQFDARYLSSSSKIMELLNQSVCNVESHLMATSFVGIIDRDNGQLTYTNASHNSPFILPVGEVSKNSIRPLVEVSGNRLGQGKDSDYEEHQIVLLKGEKLLIYTDGLIEAENNEGKQWGKRNFLKSLSFWGMESVTFFNDGIIGDLNNFLGEIMPNDDITLLTIGMGNNPTDVELYGVSEETASSKLAGRFNVVPKGSSASTLVYSGGVEKLFCEINDQANYKNIIPFEDLERFTGFSDDLNATLVFRKDFSNESVTEISDSIRDELKKLDLSGQFNDVSTYLITIGTELVQNALIYQRKYNDTVPVRFQLRSDGEKVAIDVEDHSGALTREKVLNKLKRSFSEQTVEQKEEGAGLGLSMVVRSVDKMIFTLEPGKRTRVSCLIRKYKRLKEFKQKQVSIHFNVVGDR